MSLVVRCPGCGGASRVDAGALGQMVGCPRCHLPFVAAEEAPAPISAPPPAPARKSARANRAAPRATAAIPIAPPRERLNGSPVAPQARQAPDHEHDPVTKHATVGLPLSVMVGFALMPFAIPLLWLLGPTVTGFEAAVSIAVPAALAVAAAALCLGIVYTIDWTGTTRLKGVLILVGLAYLSAAGLYFLKPALVARLQTMFALPAVWFPITAEPNGEYYVKMPGAPTEVQVATVAGIEWKPGRGVDRETYTNNGPKTYRYRFAVSNAPQPQALAPDGAWFASFGRHLADSTKGRIVRDEAKSTRDNLPGREWELRLPDSETVRIVRVYVVQGRVYYLSVEGPDLAPGEKLSEFFLDSFERAPGPNPGPQKKGRR
ncbi:hypothetical protein R5W23_000517 [Gemmata sp. JC673]|uniref:DUF4178 domain-containing protein n=1 Tax=Gemmata algarum TaxID=2975278 RepID=A0ABU5EWA6_9BACT|nr:hypothetical protein [Gemmata algarum]MDY3559524.1 hypothetical protein [Gemmata algarum]